jgi:hypothetical protein
MCVSKCCVCYADRLAQSELYLLSIYRLNSRVERLSEAILNHLGVGTFSALMNLVHRRQKKSD